MRYLLPYSSLLRISLKCSLAAVFSLGSAVAAFSQTTPTPIPAPAAAKPSATPVPHPEFRRWVEFDTISASTRYRYVETRAGATTNQNQYQAAIRGRFKFDPKGRYSIVAGLYVGGNTFNGGWNNGGWGTGDFQSDTNLRQLYFDAKPGGGVQIQVGGIAPNQGEHSEVIAYDNDGYLMGERLYIRRPKDLWFDEISFTGAYINATAHADAFRRFKYMDNQNYGQILLRKQINKHVGFSADYSYENGQDVLKQAIRFKVHESGVLDTILFENYERVSPTKGYGFNIFADKAINKKLTLNGGFARIDAPMFNADRFPPGKRGYIGGVYKFTREFSFNAIVIHAFGDIPTANSPRTRVDLIFTYNFLELMHRLRVH